MLVHQDSPVCDTGPILAQHNIVNNSWFQGLYSCLKTLRALIILQKIFKALAVLEKWDIYNSTKTIQGLGSA